MKNRIIEIVETQILPQAKKVEAREMIGKEGQPRAIRGPGR